MHEEEGHEQHREESGQYAGTESAEVTAKQNRNHKYDNGRTFDKIAKPQAHQTSR